MSAYTPIFCLAICASDHCPSRSFSKTAFGKPRPPSSRGSSSGACSGRLCWHGMLNTPRPIRGARIECGVYKGLSALLACKVLKSLDASFDGSSFFLCDSYAGLSPALAQDQVSLTVPDGRIETIASHKPGHFAVSLEVIRERFQAFFWRSLRRGLDSAGPAQPARHDLVLRAH